MRRIFAATLNGCPDDLLSRFPLDLLVAIKLLVQTTKNQIVLPFKYD